jgi:hypothetical protein
VTEKIIVWGGDVYKRRGLITGPGVMDLRTFDRILHVFDLLFMLFLFVKEFIKTK